MLSLIQSAIAEAAGSRLGHGEKKQQGTAGICTSVGVFVSPAPFRCKGGGCDDGTDQAFGPASQAAARLPPADW